MATTKTATLTMRDMPILINRRSTNWHIRVYSQFTPTSGRWVVCTESGGTRNDAVKLVRKYQARARKLGHPIPDYVVYEVTESVEYAHVERVRNTGP